MGPDLTVRLQSVHLRDSHPHLRQETCSIKAQLRFKNEKKVEAQMKSLKQMTKQCPGRRRSGMTLIEVIMSLAITGLALGGIVNGYVFCAMSSEKAALSLAANARAMERIEETRSAKWDTASWPVVDQLLATNFPNKIVTLDLSGSGVVDTKATIQTEITLISVSPSLKRIRADCIWQFKGGQWITNTVETCRAPDQ